MYFCTLFTVLYVLLHVSYHIVTVETLKILSMDCEDEHLSVVHHKFLERLWEIFNTVCRNLKELKYLVSFVVYV